MKLKIYAISVTVLLVLIVACGGSKSTPPPPAAAQSHSLVFSSTAGQEILPNSHSQSTASNFSFDLIPKVYAQTTTFTATSAVNAHCSVIAPPSDSQPGEYSLYGAGRWDSANNCNNGGIEGGFLTGFASTYIPANLDGATVFAPGTAFKLQVATSSKSSLSGSSSGKVNVYVQRNGQVLTLPLTCTMGKGNTQCSDDGNSSGHTFPLLAGDQIYIVVVLNPLEMVRNFRALLSIA